MNDIQTLKAQAKNLKLAMAGMGVSLTQAQALEAVAKQYGFENWDTAVGVLKQQQPDPARQPVLADIDFIPDVVWVEQGSRTYCCQVAEYDADALALLHKPAELDAFLREHADNWAYRDGRDTCVMRLQADGRNFEFALSDLLGLSYRKLGGLGNWLLPDGETYLRIGTAAPWTASQRAAPSRLSVPELVKSAKGCNLIVLPSGDGSEYDNYVIVPPHLDAQEVADKLDEEIRRLKELDRANEDNPEYDEYTEEDLQKFVAALGCLWVTDGVSVEENWD